MNVWNINQKYLLAVLTASIGSGFQHGYHHGVVNVAYATLSEWIRLNKKARYKKVASAKENMVTWSVVVSIFPVGGMLGSSMTAYFANKFGHKGGLIWNNYIMFLAAMFLLFAKAADLYEVFIIGRFLTGVHAGLNSGLCPIYLTEIAPTNLRGTTTASYTFVVTVSYCVSHLLSLKLTFGNSDFWPFVFATAVIPAVAQFVLLSLCPESPEFYLINLDDENKTKEALKWFRKKDDVALELNQIKEYQGMLAMLPKATMKTIFSDSLYRSPLILSLAMVVCQQTCGMEPILYFSTILMEAAGLTHMEASISSVTMGIFLVGMTLVCTMVIDVLGRKFLFLLSLCGLVIDLIFLIIVLTLSKHDIVKEYTHGITGAAVVLFAAWYALGTGTVPLVVTMELFHHLARPYATSVVVSTSWLLSFIVSLTFLPLARHIGYYIFVIYVSTNLILYLFIQMVLPETKNKPYKEIIELFYTFDAEEPGDPWLRRRRTTMR